MVKYKLVARKDMSEGAGQDDKLFYPQLVSNGRVTFEALCAEAAEQSSLTSGDIKSCMDRLVFCAAGHLREGRSVDLGDLGALRLSLRSGGTATEAEYDPTLQMRQPSIVFTPGKKLKTMRQTEMKFERVSSSASGTGTGGTGEDEERPGGL